MQETMKTTLILDFITEINLKTLNALTMIVVVMEKDLLQVFLHLSLQLPLTIMEDH